MPDYNSIIITLENYWGEKLKRILLIHTGFDTTSREFFDVENATVIPNAMYGKYKLGYGSPKDYWFMVIETLNGSIYRTRDDFYCSVRSEDKGRVTVGINGDAKTMYVHFPASGDCSTSLKLI